MKIDQALVDDMNAAAGFAEAEAAELRKELQQAYEGMIACKAAAWAYHETLVPLYTKLCELKQMRKEELEHMISCQAEDRRSIERDIRQFRARWGQHPKDLKGALIDLDKNKSWRAA